MKGAWAAGAASTADIEVAWGRWGMERRGGMNSHMPGAGHGEQTSGTTPTPPVPLLAPTIIPTGTTVAGTATTAVWVATAWAFRLRHARLRLWHGRLWHRLRYGRLRLLGHRRLWYGLRPQRAMVCGLESLGPVARRFTTWVTRASNPYYNGAALTLGQVYRGSPGTGHDRLGPV